MDNMSIVHMSRLVLLCVRVCYLPQCVHGADTLGAGTSMTVTMSATVIMETSVTTRLGDVLMVVSVGGKETAASTQVRYIHLYN